MPEIVELDKAQVQNAWNEFWNDFYEVVKAQDRIDYYLTHTGKVTRFDEGLQDLIARQRQILFDLRTVFSELYEYFNPTQQQNIASFIRRATTSLKVSPQLSGGFGLGVAPLILIGGVVVSLVAGGALLAYHRNISLQKERIKLQEKLLPLVETGKLPPEVVKEVFKQPTKEAGFFEGLFANIGNLILIGIAVTFILPRVIDAIKKK
jgi:hypothetical protein